MSDTILRRNNFPRHGNVSAAHQFVQHLTVSQRNHLRVFLSSEGASRLTGRRALW